MTPNIFVNSDSLPDEDKAVLILKCDYAELIYYLGMCLNECVRIGGLLLKQNI